MPPADDTIASELGQALVQLARHTLMDRLGRKISADQQEQLAADLEDPQLKRVCGTFVTLKIGGQLRGCIGSLEGRESLVESVRTNAISAGFYDPRFRQLSKKELDRVGVEVSILTSPQPLQYINGDDLLAKLRPRVDGVIIRKGIASATFLPQVWDQLPRGEDFLSHLCGKAGLDKDSWREGELSVETYQVQYFEEQ